MARRFLKFLITLFSLSAITGCAALAGLFSSGGSSSSSVAAPAAGAATASVPSIIDEVETSTRIGVLSPPALLDGSTPIDQSIVASQCRFHNADPPFLVPTTAANKWWTFTGRLNEAKDGDGTEREGQALEYRSWFGFGWPKQQLNSWPVSMYTLSEMPRVYLEDRIGMLSDHAIKINQQQADALTKQYIDDSQKIQDRVQLLVSAFDPSKCGPEPKE